ncbi:MAG: hypothetical protein IJ057_02825 [Bacteroidales bacterium]|nr:hypothetical protein [Bacteroidales bacterium]
MSKKKESYFWTSYSDLMTNLFFVMLMLFVLTIAILRRQMVRIEEERRATQAQLDKIKELEESIKNIDTTYFVYNAEYKTHILRTQVKFERGKADMAVLSEGTKHELFAVRDMLRDSLASFCQKTPNATYLLIIEGQASTDNYRYNNELSYNRALSLFRFWFDNEENPNLRFFDLPCEVIIAGAGCMDGKPRAYENEDNQRFLIRILPKPGMIGNVKATMN